MKKFNEVLGLMVAQFGVSATDATIKNILDNPALASIEVDDAVVTKLTAPLLTMDAAKNNSDLHKHFTATILNTVDKKVLDSVKDFGFSDDDTNELKAITSSYDRVIALAKKVQALEAKKVGAPSGDKDALNKKIEILNAEILTIKGTHDAEINKLNGSFDNERLSWKQDSVYNTYLPKLSDGIPAKVGLTTIRTIVGDELQKKGLKVVNKDGNLSLLTAENTDYFENNAKIDFDGFINKTLANERLLKASAPTPPAPRTPRAPATQPGNPGDMKTDKFMAALEG